MYEASAFVSRILEIPLPAQTGEVMLGNSDSVPEVGRIHRRRRIYELRLYYVYSILDIVGRFHVGRKYDDNLR